MHTRCFLFDNNDSSDSIQRKFAIDIGADFRKSQWVHAPIPLSSLPSLPISSLPFLPSFLLLFPFLSPSLPLSPFPSLPLNVGSLKTAMKSGGAYSAPPAGSGAEPQRKSNLVHFFVEIEPINMLLSAN